MQAIEKAIQFMKGSEDHGAQDRRRADDPPISDFPDVDFDDQNALDPGGEDAVPVMPPLRRRRSREAPVYAELPPDEAFAQAAREFEMEAVPAHRPDEEDEDPAAFGPALTWVGAAASIALVAAISIWTYKLGQRDAMEVPIIAALEGPARIAPQDPGGLQMAHQGLAVNDVLDGGGVAPVAETVHVAPASEGPAAEDAAQAELAVIAAAQTPAARPASATRGVGLSTVMIMREEAAPGPDAPVLAATAEIAPADAVTEPEEMIVFEPADPDLDATELAALVTGDAEPLAPVPDAGTAAASPTLAEEEAAVAEVIAGLEDAAPDSVGAAPALAGEEAAAALAPVEAGTDQTVAEAAPIRVAALAPSPPAGEGSAFAPVHMAVPPARPADLGAAMAAAVDAALASVLNPSAASAPAADTAPAAAVQVASAAPTSAALEDIPLPAGTRLIQLGAFDSEAVALQQWDQIRSRHGDLLGGKERYIQRITSNGRIFYRLRVAGYASKQETLAACAALTARGLPCITATLR